jgi:hypothetical protein
MSIKAEAYYWPESLVLGTLQEIPSKMFYASSLQASGDPAFTDALRAWNRLPPNTNFPVLFRGVFGSQEHEMDSPSYYNTQEANSVSAAVRDSSCECEAHR